ncbi:MAG: PTS sugar transporter subunit IIA [Bacteriovoracaceae bacterium]|nr:PTS sugar transporter subunit IIA [Bacteriovoracaceae bacterium]
MLRVYLNKKLIFINPPVKDRNELFAFLGLKVKEQGYIGSEEEFSDALEKREQKASNIVRSNIAMPHARIKGISHQFVAICIFSNGIDYTGNKDDEKIKIVFCVGSRKEEPNYLALFADISLLLMKDDFRERLFNSNVVEDVLHAVSTHSVEEFVIKNKQMDNYKVVLVLNEDVSNEVLLEILLESRIRCLTEIQSENYFSKHMKKIPFLMGVDSLVLKDSARSRMIMGVSSDKEVGNKLYLLLKNQGIDLDEPGTGVLYMSEILCSFGGIDEDVDF